MKHQWDTTNFQFWLWRIFIDRFSNYIKNMDDILADAFSKLHVNWHQVPSKRFSSYTQTCWIRLSLLYGFVAVLTATSPLFFKQPMNPWQWFSLGYSSVCWTVHLTFLNEHCWLPKIPICPVVHRLIGAHVGVGTNIRVGLVKLPVLCESSCRDTWL